ncbi:MULTISPECIES: HAD family hydrolase [unclassified Pseudactinotalea]|uniref:HAD family hydrolase n=1 Tax=unclassified Pseudactinotalea TaxID=2649176 RepID=UPI003C7B14BC
MDVPSQSVLAGQETLEPRYPLEAVLWDMDGTLMDSEPHWLAAEQELCAEHGGTWDESLALELVGLPLSVSAQHLRERAGIRGTTEEIVQTLLDRVTLRVADGGIPWRPGAAELLHELRARRVPLALVTMSYAQLADVFIDSLPEGTFSAVVTGDTVSNGKPHPEPYLTAMDRLGVSAAGSIAIEDSVPGLTAAQASGACTIGVPALLPIPAAPGRVLLDTLEGVSVHHLRQILTACRQRR